MHVAHPTRPRMLRWSVQQYDRLAEQGFFDDQHVELLDGKVVAMPPQKELHVLGVTLAQRAAVRMFGDDEFYVRPPAPLRQGRWSKPEPDVAVVRGNPRDFASQQNPSQAVLVIEVSDTTLKLDRGRKARIYAKHGIADYWIVNVVDRQIEVHRQPIKDPAVKGGYRYASVEVIKPPATLSPLAMPGKSVPAAQLLP